MFFTGEPSRVRSPLLAAHKEHPRDPAAALAALSAPDAPAWRDRERHLLFFHGAICWQIYDKVRSFEALRRKCARHHGFLDDYSFGVRWAVYSQHHKAPGFTLRATDLLPPPPHADLDDEMLHSTFCLCPSGTGWGMRVFHSIALGCLPVLIQRDAKRKYRSGGRSFWPRGSARWPHDGGRFCRRYPPVLQSFEGLLLDWSEFGVVLEQESIPRLPSLLRELADDAAALARKRAALARVWTRLLWRAALPTDAAAALRSSPDAFDSLLQSLWLRMKHGLRGRRNLGGRRRRNGTAHP